MSTRCIIGIENQDGSVESIYCHHDGYLKYVGNILKKYYNNKDKIYNLMKLGDISSLGLEPTHDKEDWKKSFEIKKNEDGFEINCLTYRDRGEKSKSSFNKNIDDFLKIDGWQEYQYLYTKDGRWLCYFCDYRNKTRYLDEIDLDYFDEDELEN